MAEELVLKGTVCAMGTPVNKAEMIVTSSRDKSVQIETVTKISDLPVNLVEEILSRVPLKYMREVRLTCKEWDSLSKSRSFSKMRIDKLSTVKEGESLMIAMMDYNLYLTRVVLGGTDEDPFVECQGRLTCLDKQIKISEFFHCDGLLLCVLRDDLTKYIVWNPYLGQTRSIEARDSHLPDICPWTWFKYGLGYEDKGSSCRGYKLLRSIDIYYDNRPTHQCSCYEIYDFDSSTWKTLDITPNWYILSYPGGVSIKGNTYWPASQSRKEDLPQDHIICFDFKSESFGPLMRLPFDAKHADDVTLSCVREEKLAVLLTRNEAGLLEFETMEYEIWISNKIEAEKVSWTKFLTVETGLYLLSASSSFFIDEEKKVAMSYYKTFNIVGEDGYLKMLKLGECLGGTDRNCSLNVWSYVPSLVQIKQPAVRGKRKQHKDLEAQVDMISKEEMLVSVNKA
ncbi:F-box/kelch-repeat protein [Raphanus sativus]|uniref:F-box protein At5g41490-like n=1 Tax=Raphanus sativus TaxID=3726 RepID=A0A9W3DRA3_RAPSA|nr:F-box protein At5g41490-like [Raphanus sativus]KAJ4916479.1 F-box/kelch-repeat protein [Raphanus sativus]